MKRRSVWTLCLSTLLCTAAARAEAPPLIPIQGYLTDSAGAPREGAHRLTFMLYDAEKGGDVQFTEDISSVEVKGGGFIVYLGAQDDNALDLALFAEHGDLWLEIVINGDEAISPRTRIGSVAYAAYAQYCGDATEAAHAASADQATQADEAQHADEADLATRATSADLATRATSADLATRATNADVAERAKAVDVHYTNLSAADGGFAVPCLANPNGDMLACTVATDRKCHSLGYAAGAFVGESSDGTLRSIWCVK